MNNVENGIMKSREQLKNFIKECSLFERDFGKVHNIECEKNLALLDIVAGLDNIIEVNNSIIGVGFRYSMVENNYSTSTNAPNFTVRSIIKGSYNTELKKRAASILNCNSLYPWLTLQYWPNFKCALLARTIDVLVNTIKDTPYLNGYSEHRNNNGDVFFNFVPKNKIANISRKYEVVNGVWQVSGMSIEDLLKKVELTEILGDKIVDNNTAKILRFFASR